MTCAASLSTEVNSASLSGLTGAGGAAKDSGLVEPGVSGSWATNGRLSNTVPSKRDCRSRAFVMSSPTLSISVFSFLAKAALSFLVMTRTP